MAYHQPPRPHRARPQQQPYEPEGRGPTPVPGRVMPAPLPPARAQTGPAPQSPLPARARLADLPHGVVLSSSGRWWLRKASQGLVLGSAPFTLGVLLLVIMAYTTSAACVTGIAMVMVLGGLGIIAWYGMAPITLRWAVDLPLVSYGVLEDRDGMVLEFVGPGPVIVPWLWGGRVTDYVSFAEIRIRTVIEDVLVDGPLVDLEVGVEMAFNPVYCDPRFYEWLRQRDQPHDFQALIVRDARQTVREHFGRLQPRDRERLLATPDVIEDLIARRLERHSAIGLTAGSSRPVHVQLNKSAANAVEPQPIAPEEPTLYSAPADPTRYSEPSEPTIEHIDLSDPELPPEAPPAEPDAGPTLRSGDDLIDPVVRRRRQRRASSSGDEPNR